MNRLVTIASIVGVIGSLASLGVMWVIVGYSESIVSSAIVMVDLWLLYMWVGSYVDIEKAIPDVVILDDYK